MVLQKKPVFEFSDVEILEFNSRPYVNKKGLSVVYVDCLARVEGKVLRLSVVKDLDLSQYVGQSVTARFELVTWGDSLSPNIVLVSAS